MDSQRSHVTVSALLGVLIILIGTLGYTVIEGWGLLDSFYMTIITIATIGYGEIRPLHPSGRLFTIFLIVFGVGNAAYLVGQLTRMLVEGSVQRVMGRRKLEKQIKELDSHYILCGYGRIGRMIAQEVNAKKLPLVVIENRPEVVEQLEKDNVLYIRGDASDEDNLLAAGIKRAVGLVSVVSSDAENMYIVLTARGLNPDLFILSRAGEEKSLKKLQRAGADMVLSPYSIGARKMAQAILRPTVSDFIETMVHGADGLDLAMEEILVTPESKLKDISLLESNIRRDLDLIAIGQRNNMDRLAELLGADASSAPQYRRIKHRFGPERV